MKVITDKIILKIQNTLLESVLVCNPDHPWTPNPHDLTWVLELQECATMPCSKIAFKYGRHVGL
jgi:hypothetical protein